MNTIKRSFRKVAALNLLLISGMASFAVACSGETPTETKASMSAAVDDSDDLEMDSDASSAVKIATAKPKPKATESPTSAPEKPTDAQAVVAQALEPEEPESTPTPSATPTEAPVTREQSTPTSTPTPTSAPVVTGCMTLNKSMVPNGTVESLGFGYSKDTSTASQNCASFRGENTKACVNSNWIETKSFPFPSCAAPDCAAMGGAVYQGRCIVSIPGGQRCSTKCTQIGKTHDIKFQTNEMLTDPGCYGAYSAKTGFQGNSTVGSDKFAYGCSYRPDAAQRLNVSPTFEDGYTTTLNASFTIYCSCTN